LGAAAMAARTLPAQAVGGTFVRFNAYDWLYRYKNDSPEIAPWLAQSHRVSDDGLTWEFKLRPGVMFHDGSELTVEDVVYSFYRVLALHLAPPEHFCQY
jgi:peptide/nickel transport system substrate-binding protein